MDVKIRKTKKEDLKVIVNIFKEESSKKPYFQKWTGKKASEKIIKAYKENDILVVLINREIGGFIIASIHPNNKTKAYIDELWLKPKYQGGGIGKFLVRKIEKIYKKKGVRIIQVVSNRKSKAYKFYQKLNYRDSRELAFMDKKLK